MDCNLKKKGLKKELRPAKPDRDPNYPTIPQIAICLLEQFKKNHPDIRIRCIFADALYGTREFVDHASSLFTGVQVISQIRANQLIRYRNKNWTVENYFAAFSGIEHTIRVRGDKQMSVIVGSARLYVKSHGKRRFVIALKYEGEQDYRYIIASDMTWRTLDIVEAYTLKVLGQADPLIPRTENQTGIFSFGSETEFLAADGGFIHEASLGVDKNRHALGISDVGMFSRPGAGTGAGRYPFGAGFGLGPGGDGHGRCRGVKFKIAAGEFIVSPFVLEKDNLRKGLSSQLEPNAELCQGNGSGHLVLCVYLAFAIGAANADASFSHRGKNRIAIAAFKERLCCVGLFEYRNGIGIAVGK